MGVNAMDSVQLGVSDTDGAEPSLGIQSTQDQPAAFFAWDDRSK